MLLDSTGSCSSDLSSNSSSSFESVVVDPFLFAEDSDDSGEDALFGWLLKLII